eukprot:4841-Pyramimonas_sp.AAC.1
MRVHVGLAKLTGLNPFFMAQQVDRRHVQRTATEAKKTTIEKHSKHRQEPVHHEVTTIVPHTCATLPAQGPVPML